jgi:hypothetical protein
VNYNLLLLLRLRDGLQNEEEGVAEVPVEVVEEETGPTVDDEEVMRATQAFLQAQASEENGEKEEEKEEETPSPEPAEPEMRTMMDGTFEDVVCFTEVNFAPPSILPPSAWLSA